MTENIRSSCCNGEIKFTLLGETKCQECNEHCGLIVKNKAWIAPKTLRDEFALMALNGILSNEGYLIEFPEVKDGNELYDGVAKEAYKYADSMIKAREAKQ